MNTIQITDNKELKTSDIMNMCRDKFKILSYYDDERLDKDFPQPKETTTRSFLENPKPDPETLGMSVREAEEKGHTNGITLRERLLLELVYFEKTGEHLDVKGLTLCSGSRNSDGYVPCMNWYSDGREVLVSWCNLDFSLSDCGLRSAVSLNTSSLIPSELDETTAIKYLKERGFKITKEEIIIKEY